MKRMVVEIQENQKVAADHQQAVFVEQKGNVGDRIIVVVARIVLLV